MVTRIASKIKQMFHSTPARPRPRRLSLYEALDLSLSHGYAAVNWQGW